jgi:histone deacetylase 1/2
MGFSPQHKGHKCLDGQGRVYISKDVVFHELKFPYMSLFGTTSTTSETLHNSLGYPAQLHFPSQTETVPTSPDNSNTTIPISQSQHSPQHQNTPDSSTPINFNTPNSPNDQLNHNSSIPHNTPQTTSPLSPSQTNELITQPISSQSTPQPPPNISHHNNHHMITRGKTGNLKPKVFLTEVAPQNVKLALSNSRWLQAMQSEYKALMDNHTWTLVPLPAHRKAIGCKWIFWVKENPDGSVNKFKARLVAKGFLQTAGFDFTETFSPVIKPVTIRIILTLAVTYKWQVQQIDVNNAFLNGVLQEEVYMQQPAGFEAADKSLVCKLHKSLYGLKQAPRAWYDKLTQALLQMGFVKSRCDPFLLVQSQKGYCTYVLIYVDDILVTGSSPNLIQDVISKLNSHFALKQLGSVDYFLGIEVHNLPTGALLLNQAKYIHDLLCKAKMENCKPIGSPMMSSCKLSKIGSDTMTDPTLYRSTVGALQYATLTRPDIAFSVNKVCQFMSQPLESHWKAVKRILRYLKGTLHHGLLLNPATKGPPFSLHAYSDADWGSDQDDRRSTSGSCIYFGPNLVSWGSKKQPLVARSSTEAEYRSMANTTAELMWIQSLLQELKVPYHVPTLLCDNLSAVSLAHNPVLHARTKHIELDIHFVREKVLSKQLTVLHVPAADQLADSLTKPVSLSSFDSIRTKLKVISSLKPP